MRSFIRKSTFCYLAIALSAIHTLSASGAEVTEFDDFNSNYSYNAGFASPSTSGYLVPTNIYINSARSTDSSTGVLFQQNPSSLVANDLVGSNLISAQVDSNGRVVSGNLAIIGSSQSLGIARGTTLISATITAAEYDNGGSFPVMRLRARVDSMNPALREITGTINSVLVVDSINTGLSNFDSTPWNDSYFTASGLQSPGIYLSQSSLPLTPDEGLATVFVTGTDVPANSSYNASTNRYVMVTGFGDPGEEGRISSYPDFSTIANDLVGQLDLEVTVDENGIASNGNFAMRGFSPQLGINFNSVLMEGSVDEAHYGLFNVLESRFEFLINVLYMDPTFEAAVGTLETVVVYDYQLPSNNFVNNPWSESVSSAGRQPAILFGTPEPFSIADTDVDGIANRSDNCTNVSNGSQRDADGDGIGSDCDTDLNNDCAVNFLDLSALAQVFFTNNAAADFNGDGSVNFLDLAKLAEQFNSDFSSDNPSSTPNICNQAPTTLNYRH